MDLEQLQKELSENEDEDARLYEQYKQLQQRLAAIAGRRSWLIQRIWAIEKENSK